MKGVFRKHLKQVRKSVSREQVRSSSLQIFHHLMNNFGHLFRENQMVGGYVPINEEVDCLLIFEKMKAEIKDLQFSLCRITSVKERKINFVMVDLERELELEQNKLCLEPSAKYANAVVNPKIVLTPLLGFDSQKNRLGYGMAFFDNYFLKNPETIKIGIAYQFQFLGVAEREMGWGEKDVNLDFVVTDKLIY